MSNILFIVTESRSANGVCTDAVMQECLRNKHQVFCLTNREYGGEKQYEKNGVTYNTVKPRLHYRIASFISHNNKMGKTSLVFLKGFNSLLSKLKLLITCPLWPWISPAYSERIYREASKICRNHQIDTVIPIYTQIDTLIAAKKIKQKNPEILYIPYFLDSLSGGFGPKFFSPDWTVKKGLFWERKLLPLADRIVMMKSSREHYEKYSKNESYFERIHFLDLPLFQPKKINETNRNAPLQKAQLNLLFIGTIPESIRPPQYFMELFSLLSDPNLHFTIVGSSTCESYLQKRAGADPRITLSPFVDHDTALNMMESADVLVNFGNTNSHMTPSKIFEYMSFGKPILSTAPIPNEPSIPYLEQYPFHCIIDYSIPLAENAEKVSAFLQETKFATCDPEEVLNRFYLNTPTAFYQCIAESISKS